MADSLLKNGFKKSYETCEGGKQSVAFRAYGGRNSGCSKASRVFQDHAQGRLRPSWDLLDTLLEENPWPILRAIEKCCDVVIRPALDGDPIMRAFRAIGEAQDLLSQFHDELTQNQEII